MLHEFRRATWPSWVGMFFLLLAGGVANALDSHEIKNSSGEPVFVFHFADETHPTDQFPSNIRPNLNYGPGMSEEQKQAIIRAGDYWVERVLPTGKPVEPVSFLVASIKGSLNAFAASSLYTDTFSWLYPSTWLILVEDFPIAENFPDRDIPHAYMGLINTVLDSNGQVSPNNPFTTARSGQLSQNTWEVESVFVHELGHALGILSYEEMGYTTPFSSLLTGQMRTHRLDPDDPYSYLANPRVFLGEQAMAVYGAPVPMSAEADITQADSHMGIFNNNMTHRSFRNYTGFTEVELAIMNDMGYDIDLRNFFGRSLFFDPDGTVHDAQNPRVVVNDNGFFARNAAGDAYRPGEYNTSSLGLGLHLFGDYIHLTQKADLLSSGFGGGGIRSDGVGNRITIDSGVRVHALGELGVGLLVSYGHDTRIIHRGDLEASGPQGVGLYFGMGPGMLSVDEDDSHYSYFFGPFNNLPELTPDRMARLNALDLLTMPDPDDPDYDTKIGDYAWVHYYYIDKEIAEARAALDGALVTSADIGGRVAGDVNAIYIDPYVHVERINFLQGAEISGNLVSDYTGLFADMGLASRWLNGEPGGVTVKDMRTTLTFGLATAPDGSALDGVADDDFRFTFQHDIYADPGLGYGFDGVFAGGRTEFSGSRLVFQDVTTGIQLQSGDPSAATLVLTGPTRLSTNTYLQNAASELILQPSPEWVWPRLEGREIFFEGDQTAISLNLIVGMTGVETTLVTASKTLDGLSLERIDLQNRSYALAYDLDLSAQALTLSIRQRPDAFLSVGGMGDDLTGFGAALDRLAAPDAHGAVLDPLFAALNRFPDADGIRAVMREMANDDFIEIARDLRRADRRLYNNALQGALSSYRQKEEAFVWTSNATDTGASAPSPEAYGLAFANIGSDFCAEGGNEIRWDDRPMWSVFGQGFGGFGETQTERLERDYDYNGAGFLLGSARRFGDDGYAGVSAGYSRTRADLDTRGEIRDEVLRFGPVIGYARANWFAEFAPTLGIHWLDSQRRVSGTPAVNGVLESDHTGYDLGAHLSGGHTFAWDNGFRLTPSVDLDYAWLVDSAYTERGDPLLALKSERWATSTLSHTFMLKAGWVFAAFGGRLLMTPEVWAGWEHEYLDGDDTAGITLVSAPGTSWNGYAGTMTADRALLGVGMKAAVNECLSWQFRFEQRLWQQGQESAFSLGFRLDF